MKASDLGMDIIGPSPWKGKFTGKYLLVVVVSIIIIIIIIIIIYILHFSQSSLKRYGMAIHLDVELC